MRPDGKLEVRTRKGSQSPSKRNSAMLDGQTTPQRGTFAGQKRGSFVDTFELPAVIPASPTSRTEENGSPRPASVYTARTGSPGGTAPNFSMVQREQKEGLLNDNWYVLDEDTSDMGSLSRRQTPAPPPELAHLQAAGTKKMGGYIPVHDRHDSFEPAATPIPRYGSAVQQGLVPKPLGMHPPTPPMPEMYAQEPEDDGYGCLLYTSPSPRDGLLSRMPSSA